MKVIDEELLKTCRTSGLCEYCGKSCRSREPHHLFCRGIGGGGRLDIPINLLALGAAFECPCHRLFHAGKISRLQMLEKIAEREGRTADDIEAEIRLISRTPKGWPDR